MSSLNMAVRVREKLKGSGVWWVFVSHGYNRASMKIGDKEHAEKTAIEFRKELKAGRFQFHDRPAYSPTVTEYYKRFEKEYLFSLRPRSQEGYDWAFRNHIIPAIGSTRLANLNKAAIRVFIATLRSKDISKTAHPKHLTKASIRIIVSDLETMLNAAIEDGIIHKNPAAKCGKFYKEAHTKNEQIQPLKSDEVVVFLKKAKELSPHYYCLFLCAIHAGLRAGEIAGLQRDDIDWHGRFLLIRRTFSRGKVGKPKNGKIRKVDISAALLAELKAHLKAQDKEWSARGSNTAPDWVFSNYVGNPPDMKNVTDRHFNKCLKEAGLRRIRFHDLRHTFATLLIMNGESLAYVKDQLGHSSIRITVDTYGHWIPGANRQAVDKLPTIEAESPAVVPEIKTEEVDKEEWN